MRKVSVIGNNSDFLKKELEKYGFVYDEKNPDFVVSYGGDGTYLISERNFPGIPKVLIRCSKICNKCNDLSIEHILERIKNNKFRIEKNEKVQAVLPSGETLFAVNEFCLRNEKPIHAVRFNVYINELLIEKELIGDGVVVCTPFGSTGYFYSITRKKFLRGFGVAFNNPTVKRKPLILKKKDEVRIELVRGDAMFSYDNNPGIRSIKEGEIIKFKLSNNCTGRIIIEKDF